MKSLRLLLMVFIFSTILVAQEKTGKTDPYPNFIPYQNVETSSVKKEENFDKDIGKDQPSRWLSVDPLADKFPGWSPYNYALNNPLIIVDPNGMDTLYFNNQGQYLADQTKKGDGDHVGYYTDSDGILMTSLMQHLFYHRLLAQRNINQMLMDLRFLELISVKMQ